MMAIHTIITMGIKKKKKPRDGITTGACAAAASAAAVEAYFKRVPDTVSIALPDDAGSVSMALDSVTITPAGGDKGTIDAAVVKDAGDDPDVTHGARVGVTVTIEQSDRNCVIITGGPGVGTVTRPGLPVAVGQAAINPVPRSMITQEVLRRLPKNGTYFVRVAVYVENGEKLARKTLNPRLGIVGGLSILGTSGIVKPFSAKSYRDTIDICLRSARSGGQKKCVLTTGRRSERVARQYDPKLSERCFVQFADFFSYAVAAASRMGFEHIVLTCFFGKLCKWAMNMAYTHARSGHIDFKLLSEWALCEGCSPAFCRRIETANNAREIFESGDTQLPLFIAAVGRKALENAAGFMTHRARLTICLWDFKERFYTKWDTWHP